MLNEGDWIKVSIDTLEDIGPSVTDAPWLKFLLNRVRQELRTDLEELPIKRPYLINMRHVEYVEGTWNDDKSEYGIRIGYASGATRCFWGSTARSVLEALVLGNKKERETYEIKESICKKFDDRVKVGPPSA